MLPLNYNLNVLRKALSKVETESQVLPAPSLTKDSLHCVHVCYRGGVGLQYLFNLPKNFQGVCPESC